MRVRERLLHVLETVSGPICDDCLAARADLPRRQAAFRVCTALARAGELQRGKATCVLCGHYKDTTWWPGRGLGSAPTLPPAAPSPADPDRPWYWEGNVQARIVEHLERSGYAIRRAADTASRAQGKDIVALAPDGRELWVTVKGFPEKSRNTQARHWFASAVFDLIVYREENPSAHLALGLPDGFSTYQTLASRISWLRNQIPFAIYWVDEAGDVRLSEKE